MPMPVIEALDLNKDRIIDAAELAKATESLKKLDKNRDGKLSAEEFRPAPGRGMGPPPE
jgi:Ca2+-binding EF-hand superfamily protein